MKADDINAASDAEGNNSSAHPFIIDTVLHEPSAWSLYYEDSLALYYAVARAFRHSSPRLSILGEHIVSRILERAKGPKSFNPLQASFASRRKPRLVI